MDAKFNVDYDFAIKFGLAKANDIAKLWTLEVEGSNWPERHDHTLMVCITKTSFLFLLDKETRMILFRADCLKYLFSVPFEKNGPVYPFRFLSSDARAVACYVRALFDLL